MIMLTEDQVNNSLPKIAEGLQKYCWIQDNFRRCDVSKDRYFQTRFNDFYKVRRNAGWRDHYYKLMEAAKNDAIQFPLALRKLREKTGRIEASFASKLVATHDPSKPVIDKFVLNNFDLCLPYYYESNREFKTVQVYNELCQKYRDLLKCPISGIISDKFGEIYPWANITDLKKVDLILWQTRS